MTGAPRVVLNWLAPPAVFAAACAAYALTGPPATQPTGGARHFVYLAHALLTGHLELVATPPGFGDMTRFGDQWYVAFPPLPAVLLMPVVAVQGFAVNERLVSMGLGAINCVLSWVLLGRIGRGVGVGVRLGLTVTFAVGTVHWYSAQAGTVWFFAHVVAATWVTLYCIEVCGRNRPVVAAAFLGLAGLARTATLCGFPLFVALTWARARQERWSAWRLLGRLAGFGLVEGAFVGLIAGYNQVRFGSPTDFGYMAMRVADPLLPRLREHGQFSLAFLPENLYYFLLAPPLPTPNWVSPYLEANQWGMGLLFVSPVLLLGLRAPKSALAVGAALSAVLVALPNLLYYNTGWVQYGFRFAQDFLPFLVVLAALGARGRLGWLAIVAIVVSVGSNYLGMRWFFKLPLPW